jgi:eukaryotic-like serine/threonine-protein kinase
MLQPGQRLSQRYRIETLLAKGGMGEVYHAYDEAMDRPVAIKVLPQTFSGNEQWVERFQRQAPAAARIRHPGIVETYDRGTDGDLYYVVMERLEGQDLHGRIRERFPLDVGFTVRVGVDIARAAYAAHKKGVIHRDLKPSNIFLASTGDQVDVVKVLDFGVAKVFNAKSLTKTGQIVGTLSYMAPEQLQSSKDVDARADVYSIGCILYEMLIGTPPFRANCGVELIMKITQDQPEPIANYRADVPDSLVAVIERAMAKKCEDRYPSAHVLAEDLSQIAATLGVFVPPHFVTSSPPSPHPPAAWAVAPTLLSTPPRDSSSDQSTLLEARDLTEMAAPSVKSRRKLAIFVLASVAALLGIIGIFATL